MNTVVSINLNGNAYQVDENGYSALKNYLAAAEIQLAGNPDRAEIMTDLEQAIADKCRRFLGPHKTVVSEAEVRRIVEEMGPVDAAAGETKDEAAERERRTSDAPKNEPGSRRRLYRIHEGSMLAGVCAGIAAYTHADPTIVRFTFIILTILTWGAFAITYIVLALVTPAATTPEQRAAAHGKPFSAQNVIDDAKRTYEEFRNDNEWKRHWRRQKREWRRMSGRGALSPFPIFMMVNLVLPIVAIFAMFALFRRGPGSGFWFTFRPGFMELMLILVAISMLTAPFRAARRAARYSTVHGSPLAAAWMGLLWLFCLVSGAVFLYLMVPQVHYIVDNLPDILGSIFDR